MAVFAAIVWKELTQISNRRRFAVEKSLIIAGIGAAFLFTAYSFVYEEYARSASTYSTLPSFGRSFFFGMAYLVSFVLSIAALVATASNITSEYVRGTMGSLLITCLSPRAILGAKVASVWDRVSLGLIVPLPLLALLSAFGGVDWRMVAAFALSTIGNVWLYGCMGLFVGAGKRDLRSSIASALALGLAWMIVGYSFTTVLYLLARVLGLSFIIMNAVLAVLPGFLLSRLMMGAAPLSAFAMKFGLNVLFGAVFFMLAVRSFKRKAVDLISAEGKRTPVTARPPRRRWWARRRRLSEFAFFIGPGIVHKELSVRTATASLGLPIVFLFCWMLVILGDMAMGSNSFWGVITTDHYLKDMFTFEGSLIVLALSLTAATRISGEREAGTLQILGLTPLGPFQILAGKAGAILLSQAPALLFLFLHSAVIVSHGMIPRWYAPFFPFAVVLAMANAVILGMYMSLCAKRSAQSSVAVVVSLFAGLAAVSVFDPEAVVLRGIAMGLAVIAVITIAAYSRNRAPGLIAHFLSYVALLTGAVCATFLAFPFPITPDVRATVCFLPVGALDWHTEWWAGIPVALCVLPAQLVLFAWMVWLSLSTFDAQVRRST